MENKEQVSGKFAFGKKNYTLLIAGFAVVIIGFLFMVGGASDDPTVFNEEVFSFRRVTLAPVTVVAGYAIVLYSILMKPKQ